MAYVWFQALFILSIINSGSAQNGEYDNCPETHGATVWIDNAPDCQANSSYCHHFGLEYVCSNNITEEGHSCFGGTQVQCTHPPPPPLATPLPATTLKLISYNVWELQYLVAQDGQRERTCRIPAEILKMQPDVDVIVFEEMFMGGCLANDANNSLTARDILNEYGFVHYTRTVGDSLAILQQHPGARAKRNTTADNGGVFVASRWPIIAEDQAVFENYDGATSDALSAKGVMYARVQKTVDGASKNFHIFGTHMQSTEKTESPGIRVLQAGEIFDFMQKMSIPPDEPVIYAGDLNGDLINKRDNALAIMDALNATMPELTGPINVTYDHQKNDNLYPTDKAAEFLDYILISRGHEQPISENLRVLRPQSEEAFEVCRDFRLFMFFMYPHSTDCRKTKIISDLADHYAVMGLLEYSTGKEGETPPPGVPTREIDTTSGSSSALHGCTALGTILTMMITLLPSIELIISDVDDLHFDIF